MSLQSLSHSFASGALTGVCALAGGSTGALISVLNDLDTFKCGATGLILTTALTLKLAPRPENFSALSFSAGALSAAFGIYSTITSMTDKPFLPSKPAHPSPAKLHTASTQDTTTPRFPLA